MKLFIWTSVGPLHFGEEQSGRGDLLRGEMLKLFAIEF